MTTEAKAASKYYVRFNGKTMTYKAENVLDAVRKMAKDHGILSPDKRSVIDPVAENDYAVKWCDLTFKGGPKLYRAIVRPIWSLPKLELTFVDRQNGRDYLFDFIEEQDGIHYNSDTDEYIFEDASSQDSWEWYGHLFATIEFIEDDLDRNGVEYDTTELAEGCIMYDPMDAADYILMGLAQIVAQDDILRGSINIVQKPYHCPSGDCYITSFTDHDDYKSRILFHFNADEMSAVKNHGKGYRYRELPFDWDHVTACYIHDYDGVELVDI